MFTENLLSVRCLLASIVLYAASLSIASTAHAALILQSNYEFKNSLTDSLGVGNNLVRIGTPTLGTGQIVFNNSASSQGLILDTEITQGDYRVEFDIQFGSLNAFNKLIDFKSQTRDDGLYARAGGELEFIVGSSKSGQASEIRVNQPYTIGLEKIGNSVGVYLGSTLQFAFSPSSPAVSNSIPGQLVFFADNSDFTEGTNATVTGLRLYATAVPEPSSFVMVALVSAVSGWSFRRKKKERMRQDDLAA